MSTTNAFFKGFEKSAAEQGDEKIPPWAKRYALPAALAATLVGAGAYALSRSGGKRLVAPVIYEAGDRPRSFLGKAIDRIRYGADEIVENVVGDTISKANTRTLRPGEVSFVRDFSGNEVVRGAENRMFGSTKPVLELFRDNKGVESQFIRKVAPKFHPNTEFLPLDGTPKDKLETLKKYHEKWKGKDYLIKDVASSQTGPGADNFVSRADVESLLKNKDIPAERKPLLKNLFGGELKDQFIIQEKMKPVTDKITGRGVEFRVHTVGDRVLDTSVRTVVTPLPSDVSQASDVMKEFVSKMPKELRDSKVMFAADVLKTEDGFKIVELNPGGASGYLDPNFMKKKGLFPHLKSIFLNNRLYEELAGRKSPLMATGRAVGAGTAAGAATAGGIYAYDKKDEIAERFKPA